MSPAATAGAVITRCDECDELMSSAGQCLNVEGCTRAISAATRSASRDTAKTSVAAASAGLAEPRAFTSSGRVD